MTTKKKRVYPNSWLLLAFGAAFPFCIYGQCFFPSYLCLSSEVKSESSRDFTKSSGQPVLWLPPRCVSLLLCALFPHTSEQVLKRAARRVRLSAVASCHVQRSRKRDFVPTACARASCACLRGVSLCACLSIKKIFVQTLPRVSDTSRLSVEGGFLVRWLHLFELEREVQSCYVDNKKKKKQVWLCSRINIMHAAMVCFPSR